VVSNCYCHTLSLNSDPSIFFFSPIPISVRTTCPTMGGKKIVTAITHQVTQCTSKYILRFVHRDLNNLRVTSRTSAYALLQGIKDRAHGHHELCPKSHESCLKLIGTTYFVPSLLINTQITMSTNSYIASSPCNITGSYFTMYSITIPFLKLLIYSRLAVSWLA
jgi:hypothetical protein